MAVTDPQVSFKLDLQTLDNLRASMLRDYETLSHIIGQAEMRRDRVRKNATDARPLTPGEEAELKETQRQHFQLQQLLRFFSVDAALIRAAEARAGWAAP